MTRNQRLAVWALIAVAVGYALLNLAIRLMADAFEPLTQTYLRIFLGLFIALVIFRNKLRPRVIKKLPRRDWLVLLLMGVVGYSVGVGLITLGAINAKLVNVSVLTSTIPFFVAIYSYFALRKKVSRQMLILLMLSFVGAAMVATKAFPPVIDSLGFGEVCILLASAAFAWYSVGRKLLSDRLNNYEISVLTMAIAAVSALIFALVAGESLNLAGFLDPMVLLGLAIGAGFNIIASMFENFAFQHINAVAGSQLLLIENAVAPLFGYFFYSELVGGFELLGAAIIIVSVLMVSRLQTED